MSLTLSITDGISPELQRQMRELQNPRGLMAAAGKRVEVELRAHFERRNAEANKQGWPKRGFWMRIRRATALAAVSASSATVAVADPALNLKVHGGDVTPKRGKYLAIPATPEAYAAGSPREGGLNLQFDLVEIAPGRFAPALVEAAYTTFKIVKGKNGPRVKMGAESWGGRVHYWLTRKAHMEKDPTALPEREHLQRALRDEVVNYVSRLNRRLAQANARPAGRRA